MRGPSLEIPSTLLHVDRQKTHGFLGSQDDHFFLLNDEQMSNKMGIEHQPVDKSHFIIKVFKLPANHFFEKHAVQIFKKKGWEMLGAFTTLLVVLWPVATQSIAPGSRDHDLWLDLTRDLFQQAPWLITTRGEEGGARLNRSPEFPGFLNSPWNKFLAPTLEGQICLAFQPHRFSGCQFAVKNSGFTTLCRYQSTHQVITYYPRCDFSLNQSCPCKSKTMNIIYHWIVDYYSPSKRMVFSEKSFKE